VGRVSGAIASVTVTVSYSDGTQDETVIPGPASGVSVARRRAGTSGPVRYHWTVTVYDVPAAPTDVPEAPAGRRQGTVTRWDVGATAGFLTADDGVSWFVSQNSTSVGKLAVGTVVSFVGVPRPKPGKKYPEAYDVRAEEQEDGGS
jgi:hypothetical protein